MTRPSLLIATLIGAVPSATSFAQAFEEDRRSAGVAIVAAEPAESVEMKALDGSGRLGQAELIERLQNVAWTERQPPTEGVPPAVLSNAFTTMFQAVAGGGGGSQDLARVRDDWPD